MAFRTQGKEEKWASCTQGSILGRHTPPQACLCVQQVSLQLAGYPIRKW